MNRFKITLLIIMKQPHLANDHLQPINGTFGFASGKIRSFYLACFRNRCFGTTLKNAHFAANREMTKYFF